MTNARTLDDHPISPCSVLMLLFAVVFTLSVSSLTGCTSLGMEDCTADGSKVLGQDVPRIRSSRLRMVFADPSAAAARFAPYAVMSALAYAEDEDCAHEPKLSQEQRQHLEARLNASVGNAPKWQRVPAIELAGLCEDELGLFYHVWQREVGDAKEVVMAFRGTWGWKDWYYGNLRWFTRFILSEDQYDRARAYSDRVIAYFKQQPQASDSAKPVRFYSTGHSLGGGLAQTVLYQHPDKYVQAFTFDPSPVTGFTDQSTETRLNGCACTQLPEGAPPGETRIYRFYESYEVLTHLRIWHKMFFTPHRHVHEIRFAFERSPNLVSQHSMVSLAMSLTEEADRKSPDDYARPWYTGEGKTCTAKFESLHQQSCQVAVKASDWNLCPP
jgi:hypothetical protein